MNQCFKIKNGTDYDKAVKEHFAQRPLWKNVFNRVSELFGEKITEMALVTDELWINTDELTKDDNKQLFTQNGKLKQNTKKSKEILEKYKQIVLDEGLADFQELRLINFGYGVMRTHGQNLESFVTSEDDIYYKANFNLEKRTNGLVIPITEIEYEEKYLEELRKREMKY